MPTPVIQSFAPLRGKFSAILTVILLACLAPLSWAQDASEAEPLPTIGPDSGLPLPRFVALRSDEARMRVQPSVDHAIAYIYLREGLPMKVLEERGDWRRVADHEGKEGWMNIIVLSNDRTFRVLSPLANLYARADRNAPVRAEMEAGVIGDLRQCRADGWCRADVQGVTGWLEAIDVWGVLPGETF